MVTLTKHVISGPDLHCARPLELRGFLQHLPAKCKRRPKKVLLSEQGPGTVPYGKYGAGYCITLIKSLGEGLR